MTKNVLPKVSRIISEVFNGFFTMLLIPILAIVFSPIPLVYKIVFPLLYTCGTIITYFIFRKKGLISDYELTKREERPPYFTVITGIFLILFIVLTFFKIDTITHVTLALFIATCILTGVSLFWKMSGHMTYSTLLFFTLIYLFPDVKYLWLLFIFTPLIAASRVILKKHTISQVVAGTIVCAIISILILWVL